MELTSSWLAARHDDQAAGGSGQMARQIGGSADPRHGQGGRGRSLVSGPLCRPELTRILLLFPSTTRNTTTRGPLGRRLALGLPPLLLFRPASKRACRDVMLVKGGTLWLRPGVAAGSSLGVTHVNPPNRLPTYIET
ncbi:hypothetical protein GGP41_000082 [Bipolaris sorokiniana]|uniref:Uncharacterized protein n=1 Tax=Cochliobolus sativus TaxID=45130 RepID=A0A8H5ZDM8_COCSA|nr:hypothetical protein GGP41_000082 [Bipolaris sorokiniana]